MSDKHFPAPAHYHVAGAALHLNNLQLNLYCDGSCLVASALQADMTQVLLNQTFWVSYNVPFFPNIYRLAGGWVGQCSPVQSKTSTGAAGSADPV
jgi:hypothetical protein